ncbi:MAG: hypothetical protein A2Z27_01990 [candidate division Zixibacteria bacterium RBG_16_50_21]|nr:MAG: hypothetical protein A2Z27_01990 [candidate division Zixibacteria bacterium RBG_16_50_21]
MRGAPTQEYVRVKIGGFLVLFCVLAVTSCSYPYGSSNYKTLDVEKLKPGLTREQVVKTLGRGPYAVIGSKYYYGHELEVQHFVQARSKLLGGSNQIEQEYYLYFWDDSLAQWGKPGDWEREANKIIRLKLGP